MLRCEAGNLKYPTLKECSTFIFKGWWVLQLPTLKKNALCSFEIWGYTTLPATQYSITQDQNPQHEHCENLKPCIKKDFSQRDSWNKQVKRNLWQENCRAWRLLSWRWCNICSPYIWNKVSSKCTALNSFKYMYYT